MTNGAKQKLQLNCWEFDEGFSQIKKKRTNGSRQNTLLVFNRNCGESMFN